MIITQPKEFDVVLDYLRSVEAHRIFLIGCGQCATAAGTGGEPEVTAAAQRFAAAGFEIEGIAISEVTCHSGGTKLLLRKHKDELASVDAVVVFSCGAGVQTVADALSCPVFPALDSSFLGNVIRHGEFEERCQTCGDCVLALTAGICPVTQCPKGLLNGPCGGMWDGMCEVIPDRRCTHVRIIEKLEAQHRPCGEALSPKNFGVKIKPGHISVRRKYQGHHHAPTPEGGERS